MLFKKKSKKKGDGAIPAMNELKTAETAPAHADDGELVAVLAAAVAAVMGTSADGIVIRSYKRVGPSAWKRSGRDFQVLNHF